MQDNKNFLGTEPVGKLLLKLSIPTVIAQLINMLYNIVDRIYIGHIPGEGSLALSRALNREREQENPRYEEMCRRFIADQSDFSEENILNAGIEKRFQNINLDDCVKEIANYIKSVQ